MRRHIAHRGFPLAYDAYSGICSADVAPQMQAGPQMITVNGPVSVDRVNPYADPGRYRVNVPKTMEYINQPLYSYQLYPAAGATQLSFFQNPVGGAISFQDTNMQLAAQLPAPQMFLIQGIGIDYLPGTTAAPPVTGPIADSSVGQLNDFYTIMRQGQLLLTIGSKVYLNFGPLIAMPPRAHMDGVAAVATNLTIGAATQTKMQIAYSTGPVFSTVPLLLEASQNFSVSLNFPAAIAPPSGDALARIGVLLYGTLYRPAQ